MPNSVTVSRTFGSEHRLKHTRDFNSVFRNVGTKVIRVKTLLFYVCQTKQNINHGHEKHCRLGIAVSRKTAKRAVHRNRMKRLIRESFRHHQHYLPKTDIIVVCKPGSNALGTATVCNNLIEGWARIAH